MINMRLRPMRNETTRCIDMALNRMGMYEMLNLQPYLETLNCRKRWAALKDMELGMPSGTIEHWSWMPGGGRAGIAAHVVWKVC